MNEENSHSLATLASEFVQYFEEVKAEGFIPRPISTSHGLVDLAAEIEILDNGAIVIFTWCATPILVRELE